MLKADLIDRIAWFRASSVVGGDGLPTIANLGLSKIADVVRFERRSMIALGPDSLEILTRRT